MVVTVQKFPHEVFEPHLTPRQTMAMDFLQSAEVSEVLAGGGKGGGKSVFACYYALEYAQRIIADCKIDKIAKYPYVIGWFGRVRAIDFSMTTLATWKKFIPDYFYKYNEKYNLLTLFGRVQYQCGGMDNQEDVRKFNSAEYGVVIVDQAEEMSRDQAAMLRGTQGRAKINGVTLPIKALYTANPGECFLKDDFNPHNDPNIKVEPYRKFVQALAADNTFIDSKRYSAQLIEAWKHHPDILRAYVYGDWSATAGGGFLIDRETCARMVSLNLPISREFVWGSGDPAWLGEKTDEIVDYIFTDNRTLDASFKYSQETTATAADWIILLKRYKGNAQGIDCIGVGAGVTSDCRALVDEKKIKIHALNSSRSCDDFQPVTPNEQPKVQFLNERAEQYWLAIEEIKEGKWVLPNDPELINQLCSVKYEIRNGKVRIEPKADIKKRIGRSPDRADAFVQGIWMKVKGLLKPIDYTEEDAVIVGESRSFCRRRRK